MEHYKTSQQKIVAFDWIARHRTQLQMNQQATSQHLMTALGDVECDKTIASKAVQELQKAGTLTDQEAISLLRILDATKAHITIGQLAFLVHTVGKSFYQKL